MSNTTIRISDTLNWIFAFISGRPTTGVGGTAGEPGLTSANWVMGSMLAAPFKWPWNRAETTFPTIVGVADYNRSLASWGYIERATVQLGSATPPISTMEVHQILEIDGEQGRPLKIAPQLDDNNGNISFRLWPLPDAIYTVTVTYQKAPLLASSTNTTWAPIPDKYAFIYESGLRAHMQRMYNFQASIADTELFYRQLIAAAQGLTETEKAIFLEEQLRRLKTQQADMMAVQQGRQVRQ